MKTYVIGDLQGCHEQAVALLDRIRAHAAADGVAEPAILFAGDLINRGPDSLATLRHVRKLAMASGGLIDSVLGNHDLHLLAVAYGIRPEHKSDTLAEILHAPDRDELIDWVRQRPLAIRVKDHVLVHAGLLPQWSAAQAMALAGEVQEMLRGDGIAEFGGDVWQPAGPVVGPAAGADRLRCIINAMTRLLLQRDGVMDFKMKESGTADPSTGLMPWFEVPGRRSAQETVVFGHWSALGLKRCPSDRPAAACGAAAVRRVPGRPQPAAGAVPAVPGARQGASPRRRGSIACSAWLPPSRERAADAQRGGDGFVRRLRQSRRCAPMVSIGGRIASRAFTGGPFRISMMLSAKLVSPMKSTDGCEAPKRPVGQRKRLHRHLGVDRRFKQIRMERQQLPCAAVVPREEGHALALLQAGAPAL
jgi:bis(5'-nucleosyl)-tetraphosphatase (symmetrical)